MFSGSSGQPDVGRAMAMSVAWVNAPGGITTSAPSGCVSVPPAGPMLAITRQLTQLTLTVVTLAVATLPAALVTLQFWLAGCELTATLKAAPSARLVAKLKAPFAFTTRASPPLLVSVTAPSRPETMPPTEKLLVTQ